MICYLTVFLGVANVKQIYEKPTSFASYIIVTESQELTDFALFRQSSPLVSFDVSIKLYEG